MRHAGVTVNLAMRDAWLRCMTAALDAAWRPVRRLNRYVEEQAPWTLAKDPARAEDLDRVLRSLAEGLRVAMVVLAPWLPETARRLLAHHDL